MAGLNNIVYTITAANIATATTLTAAEKTYLNQLINAGVDLVQFLLVANNLPTQSGTIISPTNNINQTNIGSGQVFHNPPSNAIILDYVKQYYINKNIDFTTVLIQKLQSVGVNISSNGNITVIGQDTQFSQLVSAAQTAIRTGSNIPTTFVALANSFDFGYATAPIIAFFTNPANSFAIQSAIDFMNYPIPTTDDTNGKNQLEQIYWAAYYLAMYTLQTTVNPLTGVTSVSYSSSDCEQILETLKELSDEKANIAQANAGGFYSTYTQNDYSLRTTALTDLTSMFNALDGKYNCTANAAAQSGAAAAQSLQDTSDSATSSINNTLFYIVCGFVIIVCGVIVVRKYKQRGGHFIEPKNTNKPNVKPESVTETTATT